MVVLKLKGAQSLQSFAEAFFYLGDHKVFRYRRKGLKINKNSIWKIEMKIMNKELRAANNNLNNNY